MSRSPRGAILAPLTQFGHGTSLRYPVLTARFGVKPFISKYHCDQTMISTQAGIVANQPRSVNDGAPVRTKISTPLGSMVAVADNAVLYLLEFENRVALTGELRRLERDFGPVGLGSTVVLETLTAQLDDY